MINSVSTCFNHNEYSSVNLAADAGSRCIAESGIDRSDIDLLINIGIYRDKNILEPAMASLIQKNLRLNNDPIDTFKIQSAFSFDIVNGAPSFINALQLIDTLIKTGESRHALIVASDSHPSQTKHPDFSFTPFGAAIMISKTNGDTGLTNCFFKNSPDGNHGLHSTAKFAPNGQNLLEVKMEPDYMDRLKAFTIDALNEGIASNQIDLSGVKAIIVSQPENHFGRSIAEGIGLDGDLAIDTFDMYGDTLSSALILGYYTGITKGIITDKDTVLFVGTGSGLSMGCCTLTQGNPM